MTAAGKHAFTAGPWKGPCQPDSNFQKGYSVKTYEGETICRMVGKNQGLNAALIAEAGTVASETGLTPRQLAEQRDEFLDFARNVAGLDDSALTRADLNYFRNLIREYRDSARGAIAKATGGAA